MRSASLRKEKRMKRNNIIIGGILLFVMVFSMLAVYVSSPDDANSMNYNGYEFTVTDTSGGQMVSTDVNGQTYSFYSLPPDAMRMQNITGVQEISAAGELIFVKDPLGIGTQVSQAQLYFDLMIFDLRSMSGKLILSGISKEDTLSTDIVYFCNDSSISSPVVFLNPEPSTQMNITELEPYCYELISDSTNMILLRDYLIYKSLGIIQ